MSIFIAEGVVWEGETVTACANKTCWSVVARALAADPGHALGCLLVSGFWVWSNKVDDVLVVEFAARQPRAALFWDVVVCLRLDDIEEKQCPAIKVAVVVVVLGGCGRCRCYGCRRRLRCYCYCDCCCCACDCFSYYFRLFCSCFDECTLSGEMTGFWTQTSSCCCWRRRRSVRYR